MIIFEMGNKRLCWEFDAKTTKAKDLTDNNLYLTESDKVIWNMQEVVRYTDTCVSAAKISENTFSFITFNGIHYTMEINGTEVKCLKKAITK